MHWERRCATSPPKRVQGASGRCGCVEAAGQAARPGQRWPRRARGYRAADGDRATECAANTRRGTHRGSVTRESNAAPDNRRRVDRRLRNRGSVMAGARAERARIDALLRAEDRELSQAMSRASTRTRKQAVQVARATRANVGGARLKAAWIKPPGARRAGRRAGDPRSHRPCDPGWSADGRVRCASGRRPRRSIVPLHDGTDVPTPLFFRRRFRSLAGFVARDLSVTPGLVFHLPWAGSYSGFYDCPEVIPVETCCRPGHPVLPSREPSRVRFHSPGRAPKSDRRAPRPASTLHPRTSGSDALQVRSVRSSGRSVSRVDGPTVRVLQLDRFAMRRPLRFPTLRSFGPSSPPTLP